MIPLPRIALVGRPNVGKSTLFNRICGRRQAITDGRPGSTRDRNYAQVEWQGRPFEVIDTGGLLLGTDDPLLGSATHQAELAIAEADVVLLVVDARAGLLPDDEAIARRLRRDGKEVGGTPSLPAGHTGAATVTVRPGRYEMLCTVGDHAELGMTGELQVKE